jgi:hypothetical protein
VFDQLLGHLAQVAPGGALVTIVATSVLAVVRGWLVPRRSVDQLIQVQAERLAEARLREQEWRAAWDAERQTRRILDQHTSDVLEGLRTVEALLRALPAAKSGGDSR